MSFASNLLRLSLVLLLALAALPASAAEIVYRVPLRVHCLESSHRSIATTLTDADVTRVLGKVNRVWSAAGIEFRLERLLRERSPDAEEGDPTALEKLPGLVPPASFNPRAFNVYFVHSMAINGIILAHGKLPAVFVMDQASLKAVPDGIDEPLPRVLAHELGHALGLPHRQDVFNLMASGTTGTSLNTREVLTARRNASTVPWIDKVAGN